MCYNAAALLLSQNGNFKHANPSLLINFGFRKKIVSSRSKQDLHIKAYPMSSLRKTLITPSLSNNINSFFHQTFLNQTGGLHAWGILKVRLASVFPRCLILTHYTCLSTMILKSVIKFTFHKNWLRKQFTLKVLLKSVPDAALTNS